MCGVVLFFFDYYYHFGQMKFGKENRTVLNMALSVSTESLAGSKRSNSSPCASFESETSKFSGNKII